MRICKFQAFLICMPWRYCTTLQPVMKCTATTGMLTASQRCSAEILAKQALLCAAEEGLTGTKLGCGEGGCGACTVMVSSWQQQQGKLQHRAVNACLCPLYAVEGMHVVTVEGSKLDVALCLSDACCAACIPSVCMCAAQQLVLVSTLSFIAICGHSLCMVFSFFAAQAHSAASPRLRQQQHMHDLFQFPPCKLAEQLNHRTLHPKNETLLAPPDRYCNCQGVAAGIGNPREGLHPVQERLAKAHGSQCGFCTPGFVMSMYSLLRAAPHAPTAADIEDALAGNLWCDLQSLLDGSQLSLHLCSDGCNLHRRLVLLL